MSSCIINKKHLPIVLVILDGDVKMVDLQLVMDEWESLYNTKTEFFFIFNTLKCGSFSVSYIFKLATFIKKMKSRPIQYLLRSIIIVDKSMTFERNIIKLIFSIQSPCAPIYLVENAEDSLDLHTKLLNNEEISPNIICYK